MELVNSCPGYRFDLHLHGHPYNYEQPLPPVARTNAFTQVAPAKKITFYKSGDPQFGGVKMAINQRSFKSFNALMDDLSHRVPLPFGVRTITTPRGIHCISTLDQLEDGGCYLCSDKKYVTPISIGPAGRRAAPQKVGQPASALRRAAQDIKREDNPATFAQQSPRIPKKVTLVKNGDVGTRRPIILNRRNARSFKTLLDEISEIMQFTVKKLYTLDGKRVSLCALLHCPNVLVCVGREPFKPIVVENPRKPSSEKLPGLPSQSNSRGNVAKKSVIHPRSALSNRSARFSLSSEKSYPNGLVTSPENGAPCLSHCPHSKAGNLVHSLVNDDIEKRVHVNKDGSLSVEMKVRFRLLNDETLQWSTHIQKSSLRVKEACCHNCGKPCKEYDIWKNPMHASQKEEPWVKNTWYTHSSCSSTSSHRRVIRKKTASIESSRTSSSGEEYSKHVVRESSCYSETVENRVEYRAVQKCRCRHGQSNTSKRGSPVEMDSAACLANSQNEDNSMATTEGTEGNSSRAGSSGSKSSRCSAESQIKVCEESSSMVRTISSRSIKAREEVDLEEDSCPSSPKSAYSQSIQRTTPETRDNPDELSEDSQPISSFSVEEEADKEQEETSEVHSALENVASNQSVRDDVSECGRCSTEQSFRSKACDGNSQREDSNETQVCSAAASSSSRRSKHSHSHREAGAKVSRVSTIKKKRTKRSLHAEDARSSSRASCYSKSSPEMEGREGECHASHHSSSPRSNVSSLSEAAAPPANNVESASSSSRHCSQSSKSIHEGGQPDSSSKESSPGSSFSNSNGKNGTDKASRPGSVFESTCSKCGCTAAARNKGLGSIQSIVSSRSESKCAETEASGRSEHAGSQSSVAQSSKPRRKKSSLHSNAECSSQALASESASMYSLHCPAPPKGKPSGKRSRSAVLKKKSNNASAAGSEPTVSKEEEEAAHSQPTEMEEENGPGDPSEALHNEAGEAEVEGDEDIIPSSLPNTSPEEVVHEWLRKIPSETLLMKCEMQDDGDGTELDAEMPSCSNNQESLGEELEGKKEEEEKEEEEEVAAEEAVEEGAVEEGADEDPNDEAASKAVSEEAKAGQAECNHSVISSQNNHKKDLPSTIQTSVQIMKALLASKQEAKLDRSHSLPEVSPTMGRKLSNSANILITCLASLQILDEELDPSSKSSKCLNRPRYTELLNIFQALWFGCTSEKGGTSSGLQGEAPEKVPSTFKDRKDGDFTPLSSSGVDVKRTPSECRKQLVDEAEADTVSSNIASRQPTAKASLITPQKSIDPDPVWVLKLLKKIEKEFMAHYVSAMNDFKVKWNLPNSEELDLMIAQLKEEVSRRIQKSIEKELGKIKSRAGRRVPRPPDEQLRRDSSILQVENRRRRLQSIHKMSLYNDRSKPRETRELDEELDFFSTTIRDDVSDPPGEEEYCPCDACFQKKMEAKALRSRGPVVAANAPIVKAFDLQQILRMQRGKAEEDIAEEEAEGEANEAEAEQEVLADVEEVEQEVTEGEAVEAPADEEEENQNCEEAEGEETVNEEVGGEAQEEATEEGGEGEEEGGEKGEEEEEAEEEKGEEVEENEEEVEEKGEEEEEKGEEEAEEKGEEEEEVDEEEEEEAAEEKGEEEAEGKGEEEEEVDEEKEEEAAEEKGEEEAEEKEEVEEKGEEEAEEEKGTEVEENEEEVEEKGEEEEEENGEEVEEKEEEGEGEGEGEKEGEGREEEEGGEEVEAEEQEEGKEVAMQEEDEEVGAKSEGEGEMNEEEEAVDEEEAAAEEPKTEDETDGAAADPEAAEGDNEPECAANVDDGEVSEAPAEAEEQPPGDGAEEDEGDAEPEAGAEEAGENEAEAAEGSEPVQDDGSEDPRETEEGATEGAETQRKSSAFSSMGNCSQQSQKGSEEGSGEEEEDCKELEDGGGGGDEDGETEGNTEAKPAKMYPDSEEEEEEEEEEGEEEEDQASPQAQKKPKTGKSKGGSSPAPKKEASSEAIDQDDLDF
uniref:Doublecortin domain-containing protein n=1 Tax=Podarcis muralis TaxID=64176 RepID=A0A670HP04_PODMU